MKLKMLACLTPVLFFSAGPWAAATVSGGPGAGLQSYPGSPGNPVGVRFNVFVLNLLNIDDVEQTVTLDYLMAMSWHDPRLADSALANPGIKDDLEIGDIWNPGFTPINLNSSVPQDRELTIDPEGNVTLRFRNIDTFITPLNLKHFPFDHQTLRIEFLSRLYGPDSIRLHWDRDRSGHMPEFSIAGWTFREMDVRVGAERIRTVGEHLREVCTIGVELQLDRVSSFYVWKVIIPLALIVFMAWTVFWIDPIELAGQLGIASASVITMIAFQLSLAELLPKIAYLTRIDIYAFGTSILIFLALGESILTARLARLDKQALSLRMDRIMRIVYPVLLALLLLIVVI